MLITLDIGNTHIVLGLYQAKKLKAHYRLATRAMTADEAGLLMAQISAAERVKKFTGMAICSVVPALTGPFVQMAKDKLHLDPLVVDGETKTGIIMRYENPRQVGADRVVNAVAAHARFGGPVIVVDAGTATTVDVVTEKGEYLGGAIAPGIETGAEELFRRAARLHRVDLAKPRDVIGRNTAESIRSGIYYGAIGGIDEIVSRIQQELKRPARVIATGGLCEFISRDSRTITHWDPYLTLDGLRLIYERNRGKKG
jgi:type III pantothenate kinase